MSTRIITTDDGVQIEEAYCEGDCDGWTYADEVDEGMTVCRICAARLVYAGPTGIVR